MIYLRVCPRLGVTVGVLKTFAFDALAGSERLGSPCGRDSRLQVANRVRQGAVNKGTG